MTKQIKYLFSNFIVNGLGADYLRIMRLLTIFILNIICCFTYNKHFI